MGQRAPRAPIGYGVAGNPRRRRQLGGRHGHAQVGQLARLVNERRGRGPAHAGAGAGPARSVECSIIPLYHAGAARSPRERPTLNPALRNRGNPLPGLPKKGTPTMEFTDHGDVREVTTDVDELRTDAFRLEAQPAVGARRAHVFTLSRAQMLELREDIDDTLSMRPLHAAARASIKEPVR